ncbi:MAG: hypothetical protein ACUVX9_07230 [Anaerolineae bacterium]
MPRKARSVVVLITVLTLMLAFSSTVVQAQPLKLYPGTWRSGIGIKNLDNGAENSVRVLFYDADSGAKQAYEHEVTLQPGGGVELYLPSLPGALAPGSYNVEVQSSGPVGVMATNTNYDANLADSYNAMSSATEFFVPGIYNNHNDWVSELVVQNTSDNAINVSMELSGKSLATGTPVGPITIGPLAIPAHGTRSFDTSTNAPFDFDGQLGNSFLGSAKITNSENQPMAVVLFNTRVSGNSQVVVSYRGMTEAEDAGDLLVAPILYKNFNNGWRSGINVQNIDTSESVQVKLTIYSDLDSFTASSTQTIQAGKSFEWFLPNAGIFDGGVTVPDGFKGNAKVEVISGPAKIVGTVMTTNYTRAKLLSTPPAGVGVALGYVMPSRSGGTATVSAPTVYKNFGTGVWNSSLVVSNVGTSDVTLSLTFASDPGIPAFNETVSGFVLQAGKSREFYLPNSSHLNGLVVPDGFKGSIRVVATGSGTPLIAGLVQHTNYGRGVATVYLAPGN